MTSHRLRRASALGAVSLLAGVGLVGLAAAPAYAVSVGTEGDLNTAIGNSEAVIDLTADITLTSDISNITYPVTINGNGFEIDADGYDGFDFDLDTTEVATLSGVSILDADDAVAISLYDTASITLTDVTVTNADEEAFYIYAEDDTSVTASGLVGTGSEYGFYFESATGADATFSVSDSSFTDNGNGLYFYGYGTSSGTVTDTDLSGNEYDGLYTDMYDDGMDLVVTGSTMNNNGEYGVYLCDMSGTLLIENSTIDNNSDTGIDGSIYSDDGGQFTLLGSTVSNNGAGGIDLSAYDEDATFTMINSTVSGNDGEDYDEAAVQVSSDDYDGAGVFIYNSTITANIEVWAGLYASYIPVEISHSIVSGNEVNGYGDIWDDFASSYDISWSIVDIYVQEAPASGVDTASYVEGDGVIFSTEPGLGALADNGGPTLTHLPLDDSLALNAGDPDVAGEPETDQRGLERVSGTAIDIGAVEVQEEDELAATGAETGAGIATGLALLTLGLGIVGIRLARRRQLA